MRHSSTITRLAGPAAAAVLAIALVGCGSDDDSSAADDAGSDAGSGSGSGAVSTREVSDLGTVLVDSSGRTLYFAEEEVDGSISCVDACLGFWTPATPDGDVPSDIDGLDVMTRDDTGDRQLTFDGAPLYTFTLDRSPGQVTGDDLTDTFGGTSFTWQAATTEDASDSGDSSDSDEPSDTGGGYQDPYSY
jgi:predicted lipoprotein with Yx(FWY)xxD motif